MQNRLRSRVKEAVARLRNNNHPQNDAAKDIPSTPSPQDSPISPVRKKQDVPTKGRSSDPKTGVPNIDDQKESDLHPVTEQGDHNSNPGPTGEPRPNPSRVNPGLLFQQLEPRGQTDGGSMRPTTLSQCDTSLNLEVGGETVAIDTQIQLYATNAQLCHPFASPVLGYLGGLPPLYICAGANEVLRDEIIYT